MDEAFEFKSKINEFLLQDEHVLWKGKPEKNIGLLTSDIFNIAIGVFWTAFSVLWMALSFRYTKEAIDPIFIIKIFPFFGVPFLLVGLYITVIAPIRAVKKRKSVEYALSNKRVFILYNGKKTFLRAFRYTEIENITFGSDENGVGSVTFSYVGARGNTADARQRKGVYGLHNIPNVKKVYKIFCEQTGEKEQ